jgi:hypothetical protein
LLMNHFDIVWSISTCASLPRWVLEFAFHRGLSPECGCFGKLNGSNRFRVSDWGHNYFPFCTLKSVQDTFRMEHGQRVIIKSLLNEGADTRDITDRLQESLANMFINFERSNSCLSSSHRMWTLSRDDMVTKSRLDIQNKEFMFPITWNPSDFYVIDRLPNDTKMNSDYFMTNAFILLKQAIFPRVRAPHQKWHIVDLDNCSVHISPASTDWREE